MNGSKTKEGALRYCSGGGQKTSEREVGHHPLQIYICHPEFSCATHQLPPSLALEFEILLCAGTYSMCRSTQRSQRTKGY